MLLTGADILIECLKEQGVDSIFGYPGGAVLNIYDSLYKYRDEVTHYLTSHEQGAAHAADGYARATGKVGVCLATSGPGATNLVTGIATAYMDSIPMVAITGNVALPLLGKDSFQEVDIAGITMPITKHNYIVKDVNELADTIRKAFYIAKEGRPGPVLIDIPKDVTANKAEYEYKKPQEIKRQDKYLQVSDIEKAVEIIKKSKKPYIYAGGGVITADASAELIQFADVIDAPVCCSFMGLGGFPETNERYTGMVGMHGTKTSNLAVTDCDLLIAIGSRFSDRVVSNAAKFAANSQVLHIDVDPAEINKNIITYHSVLGDLKVSLSKLNEALEQQSHAPWINTINEWKVKYTKAYADHGELRPQYIMEKIFEYTNGEALITTEVGQNQMWAAQYYTYTKPRTFISSGGLGTMGFGLGASMGVKIGCPDKTVFNIAGDGSFRMNCNELGTAVAYNIPIIIVILNNHALGMVRQWQTFFYDARFSHTTMSNTTDFVKLAEAYKAVGFNATTKEEFDIALKKAIEINKTVVINCEIGSDEKVFPMVPPGAAIDELIMESEA